MSGKMLSIHDFNSSTLLTMHPEATTCAGRVGGTGEDLRRRPLFPALVGSGGDYGGLGSALEGGSGDPRHVLFAEADEFLADHPCKRE